MYENVRNDKAAGFEPADLVTVSGSIETKNSVHSQLKEYLPEGASFISYSFEDGIPEKIYARVLLLTGESFEKRLRSANAIWEKSHLVIAKRAVNVECIHKLVSLGVSKKVLVVNDSLASAMDAIESIQGIGFTQLNYVPYSPEVPLSEICPDQIDCTLCVGEPRLVPPGFGPVYDIGTRIISAETIAEVWGYLGWPLEVVEKYLSKYMERVISMTQKAYSLNERMDEANKNLLSLINSINDGMMVYDQESGRISVFNNQLRKLSGITEDVIGKKFYKVFSSQQMIEFLSDRTGLKSEALLVLHGQKIMASRFSVETDKVVCTFKSVETIQTENSKLAKKLVEQGFYSKYSFDDIYGTSDIIRQTKSRAFRLAQTDLNILIEGESGTGKELFASAIHRASKRSDKPYIAINFSSLNDSLMESELFGYEEGAFTGARRGGKAGVFEMANGGTIFLDEIGDISQKMQVGLLRVLQEKEVMRIAGERIRYVDVRIIAATNQNLLEKVRQGLFREDLYYRLKIGYLYIPPLRKRKEDVPYLAQKLLLQNGGSGVSMTPELLRWMEKQPWNGNVRELKNLIIYMNALRTGNLLDMEDIPEGEYVHPPEISCNGTPPSHDPGDQLLVLIETLLSQNGLLGRRQLLEEAKASGICMTEYRLRKTLKMLEEDGKIIMGKGKVGIRLK